MEIYSTEIALMLFSVDLTGDVMCVIHVDGWPMADKRHSM